MYFLEQSFNYTTGIDGYDYDDDVYYDDNDNNTDDSYSSSSSEEDYNFCNTNVIIGIHGNKF